MMEPKPEKPPSSIDVVQKPSGVNDQIGTGKYRYQMMPWHPDGDSSQSPCPHWEMRLA